jgi:hypothetical protein
MTAGWGRYGAWVLCGGLAAGLAWVGAASGRGPNEREVLPQANVLDFGKINDPASKLWVFDFKFKDPRLIKVKVPGRGTKVCWYLWYQVINNSPEPQTFNPRFDWVSQDRPGLPKRDQILPFVQEEIRKIEDEHDYLKIKNSVTIAAEPIPPTRKDAIPKPVTGVAIWDDIDPESNRFNIYVEGLSNGYNVSYPLGEDSKPVVLVKTLRLQFRRVGDQYFQKSDEIRFISPAQWDYRASKLDVPGLPLRKPEGKD